jgi:hypothetical protein
MLQLAFALSAAVAMSAPSAPAAGRVTVFAPTAMACRRSVDPDFTVNVPAELMRPNGPLGSTISSLRNDPSVIRPPMTSGGAAALPGACLKPLRKGA